MTATIDKFGRVVIPKKIRDIIGIGPGSKISIAFDPTTATVNLQSIAPESEVVFTDNGWPIIQYPDDKEVDFDLNAFVKEGYEERDLKLLGLND